MILWRLSGAAYARAFDGGYGLHYDGRWNSAGHAVTYCTTSPSLCVLEKLVHVQDPELLPALVMVRYEIPDHLAAEAITLASLPDGWRLLESRTQQRGDEWHASLTTPLLRVPSAIVPVRESPDGIVLINHRHPEAAAIRIVSAEGFELDTRLF